MELIKFGFKYYERTDKSIEGFDSYKIVKNNQKLFMLKEFKDKIDLMVFLKNFDQLKRYGINLPKILKINRKSYKILFKFYAHRTLIYNLFENAISEEIFTQLFNQIRFCRFSKIRLNFDPNNFVFNGKEIVYLNTEFSELHNEQEILDNDLELWLYSFKGINNLKSHCFDISNIKQLTSGEAKKEASLMAIKYW